MCNKILDEYPCTEVKEKTFLLNKGIRYSFVKIIQGVTTWKFEKTTELFIALTEYNLTK